MGDNIAIRIHRDRARSIRLEHLHHEVEALRIELERITAERKAERLSHEEYMRNARQIVQILVDIEVRIFKVVHNT